MRRLQRRGGYALYLLPLAFLGVFYLYPLLSIFDISLCPAGTLDLSAFARLFLGNTYLRTLLFTFYQALLSTAVTLLLALPCAYIFVRYRFPGKSLLLSLATLPFVLPTVVVALAFSALLGARGLVNDLLRALFTLDYSPLQLERTLAIIIIAHVFYNFAIALRIITAYWAALGTEAEEAASCLGADWRALWRDIRLPLIRPALLSAGSLVFIFNFTSFGVVLLLGGIRFATLEVQIYYQAVNIFNLPLAAALSIAQILSMLSLMVIYTSGQKKLQLSLRRGGASARLPRRRREKLMVFSCVSLMALFLFTPLLALVARSLFAGGAISFDGYRALAERSRGSLLFIPPVAAIGNSLRFALLSMLAALPLGLISAYMIHRQQRLARLFDPLFMLPLATSAVTLGFGFIVALDEAPLNLRASVYIIPIAHTLVALPFVIRSILPSLRAIPRALGESAQVLGATPWHVFTSLDLPLLAPSLVVGATFAFTVSMGEFGASLFVAQRESVTIPVVIYRLFGHPGFAPYQQALAMCVVLMLVCAVGFLLIERLRGVGGGEF